MYKLINGLPPFVRFLIPVFMLFTASCSKQEDSYPLNTLSTCISRVVPQVTQTKVSGSGIDSIKTLFAKNNLSTEGLQFIGYIPDTYTGTSGLPQTQVTATRFVNNLPVFGYDEVFIFNSGLFQTAYLITGTPQTNDLTSKQSLPYLQSAFFKHVQESVIIGGPLNAKPRIPSPDQYKDSCLVAVLGYVDAGSIPGNSISWGKTLVKVWKVTPLNGNYPLVFVEDATGFGWGEWLAIP